MTTSTLSLNYRNAADALVDSYWIRIEQDTVDETATVADAAAVLDALYQIDACNSASSNSDSAADSSTETASTLADAVVQTMDFSYCRDADGSVTVDIKVIRSHLVEHYTLRLQGGEAMATVVQEDLVTVRMDIEETVVLDYPVVGSFSCVPEPLARKGNTLRFAADQVGRSLAATYLSRWDLVTVKVAGIDGEVGSCRALAFHHGVVADVDLEVPAADDEDLSLCPSAKWDADTDYEVTCYKEVLVSRRCICSETEVESYTYQQVVPCPNREIRCPGVLRQCMHFLGTELAVERVNCDSDRYIGPGSTIKYKISDPAYYRKMCCKEPPSNLPQCPTRKTTYQATIPLEKGEDFWRSLYGPNTRFVPVAPAGGICGEWIIRQVVQAGNCCDGVPKITWNTSVSPELINPNSVVILGVAGGGVYPFRWTISAGHGFQFQNGSRTIETTDNRVRLSALVGACGTVEITVTDGCSTVVGYLRCTAGRWVGSCRRVVITVSAPRYDDIFLRGRLKMSDDGCWFRKDYQSFWENPTLLPYVSVEVTLEYWNGVHWSATVTWGAAWYGDILKSDWDAWLAGVKLPVVQSSMASETTPPSGDGFTYSCGGDGCGWECV